ncbi:MAG: MogA/MoaB family molybdenum cofactor biosynthesis protein [Sphingobacteriia bacterium]|nr:MogA/MoaB family molybdenum cofactor biosynthesis protein [Sphingobacteriia bacterium]
MKKSYIVHVITLSDRAFKGLYEDRSGPEIVKILNDFFAELGYEVEIGATLIPDDRSRLREAFLEVVSTVDIVVTTGGTGLSARDITVEVIRPMLDKEIPGIVEFVRVKYGAENPLALLSRSVAGVTDKTLVYVLPGSVKAVREYLSVIVPTIEHSLELLAE